MIYDVFRSVKDFVKKRVLGRVTLGIYILGQHIEISMYQLHNSN